MLFTEHLASICDADLSDTVVRIGTGGEMLRSKLSITSVNWLLNELYLESIVCSFGSIFDSIFGSIKSSLELETVVAFCSIDCSLIIDTLAKI